MNTCGIVILVILLIDFIVTLAADILNLHTLKSELPAEFADVYDASVYARSQAYTRSTTILGIIRSSFLLSITLAFWFAGGFNTLDTIVRSWTSSFIASGVLYIGLLLAARAALTLPFAAWSTFVVEERFGFNKTTLSTFVLDRLKAFMIAIVIGAPLLAGILAFLLHAGSYAWLFCWVAVTVVLLFIQYGAPVWIFPLFFRFTPLDEGALKDRMTAYARSVGFPLTGIFVIDGSRRSAKSNAFFSGFGANRRVALFDTLVNRFSVPELIAVLAHEIGHYKKRHIVKTTVFSILHTGFVFYILSFVIGREELYRAFFMDSTPLYAGCIFFGLLYTPVELIVSIVLNALSRRYELEADRFAAESTGAPETMVSALKNLAVHNLANLEPHPFHVILHYSHPPLPERVSMLRRPPR